MGCHCLLRLIRYFICLSCNIGTGRGGNSIWGKKFEDEYSEYLKVYPKYFRIYFFMLCLHLETDTYVVIIQVKIISKYTFFCSFSLLISDVERKYKCQF